MKHANVALFVPNNGCPHRCSFCSQGSITGSARQPGPEDVRCAAEKALASLGNRAKDAEIAFFGGSFTAIERSCMLSLLDAAAPYVRSGGFTGIRISTRPDCVPPEMLRLLKNRCVTTIELGAQSMDDAVLARCGRGHTARDVEEAAERIRSAGFSLGLQMMTGLPGDSDAGARRTAERLAALMPDCVRIYPTLALKNTALGEAYLRGEYRPETLEEAVSLCAELLGFFEGHGIPVIRLGLHASPELERGLLAGPWHPAFRELCESRRFFQKVSEELCRRGCPAEPVAILVHPTFLSRAVGQKRENLRRLSELGYPASVRADPAVSPGAFQIL